MIDDAISTLLRWDKGHSAQCGHDCPNPANHLTHQPDGTVLPQCDSHARSWLERNPPRLHATRTTP